MPSANPVGRRTILPGSDAPPPLSHADLALGSPGGGLSGATAPARQGRSDPGSGAPWPRRAARPPGPLVWIHAASVGEATSVLALIERLLQHGRHSRSWSPPARSQRRGCSKAGCRRGPAINSSRPICRAGSRAFSIIGTPIWRSGSNPSCGPTWFWRRMPAASRCCWSTPGCRRAPIARWRRWPGLIGPMLGAFALCLAQDRRAGRAVPPRSAPAQLPASAISKPPPRRCRSIASELAASARVRSGRAGLARRQHPCRAKKRSPRRCIAASRRTIPGC